MSQWTLTYFDASVSRGEECRLALHLAGVQFQEERRSGPQWMAHKPTSLDGTLPVVTADGPGFTRRNPGRRRGTKE